MKIVITVEGGVVQDIYGDDEAYDSLKVILVDFDMEGSDDDPRIIDVGGEYAWVIPFPVDAEPDLVDEKFGLLVEEGN